MPSPESKTKATAHLIFFFTARCLNLSVSNKISQTDRLLSSSVTSISGLPNPRDTSAATSITSGSPHSSPPTYQRRHQRNRHLTCNILRDQEEHRRTSLLRPSSTLFYLLPRVPPLLLLVAFVKVQSRPLGEKSIASHSCFCLVQPRRFFSDRISF